MAKPSNYAPSHGSQENCLFLLLKKKKKKYGDLSAKSETDDHVVTCEFRAFL
jgi:hypothetical protein